MPVSFDWDFEEEESGDQVEDAAGSHRRRRWLVRGATLLIVLFAVGFALRAWIKDRTKAVEEAQVALKADVALELRAMAEGDRELFGDRQDPGDSRWQAQQIARYINPRGGFAPAPGLIPAGRPPQIDQVHVRGRAGRAELTVWFADPSQTATSPLPFHVTWFYRQGDDGAWYHIAPPRDYWGVPYSWHGTRLVIRARQVEADLLEPLARDLSVLVARGCELLECPPEARYTLQFEGQLLPRIESEEWTLPALYLAGMPREDEARAAWESALKRWVIEALARAEAGSSGAGNRLMYAQLLKRLLVDLGLPEESLPVSADVALLAEALRSEGQHPLEALWGAEYDPSKPDEMRLLETEIALLLSWIEQQVGRQRVFALFHALDDYSRLDVALMVTYGLAPADFEAAWLAFLRDVTDVPARAAQTVGDPLVPPEPAPIPSIPPGDQIALLCSGRVWVGNADGTNLVPLTGNGQRFEDLYWSPDGRWLLTTWLPQAAGTDADGYGERRALFLLASNGSEARMLTHDPGLVVWARGWSPDGRQAVYYGVSDRTGGGVGAWALDIETGGSRSLPGLPSWSPDGRRLAYLVGSPASPAATLWLADQNWENARPLAGNVRMEPVSGWSPDGARLAWAVTSEGSPGARANVVDQVVLYDLGTTQAVPLITAEQLGALALSYEGELVSDGTERSLLVERPLRNVWVGGWSVDGTHVLVWAQADQGAITPTVLAAVPVDGAPARLLFYGAGAFLTGSSWSPTDPDRLAFVRGVYTRRFTFPTAFLYDLKTGPIYTATEKWESAWSPDGRWLAFSGPGDVVIVDSTGNSGLFLPEGIGSCSAAAWNPAADLSDLGAPPQVISATPGWVLANVRVHPDSRAHKLHVLGELVNYTGRDRRITAVTPSLRDPADSRLSLLGGQQVYHRSDYGSLLRQVDLPDSRSLPFSFTLQWDTGSSPPEGYRVAIEVQAEVGTSVHDDLDISFDGYDLSAWPDRFQVHGILDNPGPPLQEQVTIVVPAYDTGGRVIGWGWRRLDQDGHLSAGGHYFELDVEIAEVATELGLRVGSYKIQLFGR